MKRLNRELKQIRENKSLPYKLGPKTDGDMSVWLATILGPTNTIYEGMSYDIEITIPMNGYPFKPPVPLMITPIMHPNIENGKACLSLLKAWSPEKRITSVVDEIITLLHMPCWEERICMEPADKDEFTRQARQHTLRQISNL